MWPTPDDVPSDATPFDVRGVELSHHNGGCSFETILRRYGLDDPVLWELARLVHEADLADDRFDEPAAAGLDAICRGLTFVANDDRVLEVSAVIFDGLYEQRRRLLLDGVGCSSPDVARRAWFRGRSGRWPRRRRLPCLGWLPSAGRWCRPTHERLA